MRLLSALLSLAACGFQHGAVGNGDSSQQRDGSPDTGSSADGGICLGTGVWAVCLSPPPTTPVVLTGLGSLDTTNDPRCLPAQPATWTAAGQPASCIIAGTTIMLDDRLDVHGSRPLVLVATDSISINGILDVASHRGGKLGPGAGQFICPTALMIPTNADATNGGGGGAGGSFLTQGGDGGKGNNNKGSRGQAAAMVPAPSVLRAGCAGQDGGDGNNTAASHGVGAAGGGAVYVLAGSTLTIGGTINASGAGAAGGALYSGGGGGGSGGVIVVSAAGVNGAGRVLANGGGGAGGGSQGFTGLDGQDPDETSPPTQANGGLASGPSNNDGNPGGRGYATNGNAQNGGNSNANDAGGGAGGGGAGYVQSDHPLGSAVVSPLVTLP